MSKPVRTQAELIEMAKAELKVHADPPDGMVISVLRDGDGWEFRVSADKATQDRPGYPEAVDQDAVEADDRDAGADRRPSVEAV